MNQRIRWAGFAVLLSGVAMLSGIAMAKEIAPIPDRIGYVAGIESITLDGERWYFGFNYRDDIVVSPLIADPEAAAVFASRYMMQTSGRRDTAYWRELVRESVGDSGLAGPDGRDFNRVELARIVGRLRAMAAGRDMQPAAVLDLPGHLSYLLGAACGWTTPEDNDEYLRLLQRLLLEEEDYDSGVAMSMLQDEIELPGSATRSDAARMRVDNLDACLDSLPANWGELFSILKADQ